MIHSLALVNRGVCSALAERGHEVALRPASGYQPPGTPVALPDALAGCMGRALSGAADVHVMHQWPPDFTPPEEGRWVVMQPWEFGSIPAAWLESLRDRVDEVWVPSRFVRDCFVRDGVPAGKVHVVPLGVPDVFFRSVGPRSGIRQNSGDDAERNSGEFRYADPCPQRNSGEFRYALNTDKRYKFLFVGGTVQRKGFDLLLKAYRQVFCGRDDVCLVVKEMGAGTFYNGQTAQQQIEAVGRLPDTPAIEYITAELSEAEMAGLYAACDCAVLPYRGEGFCLPAAEAMASARPLIVTGYGPVLDYATEETAYLLPYCTKPLGEQRVDRLATVNMPFLAEPDHDALRYLLRYVYEHPEEARERGRRAREQVRGLTWDNAAAVVERRVDALSRSRLPGGTFASVAPAGPARQAGPTRAAQGFIDDDRQGRSAQPARLPRAGARAVR